MNATANEEIPMNDERRTRGTGGGPVARLLGIGIAAALVAGALPAVAGAADYCVDTDCGGTKVATLEEALAQAANTADADRILLGAGDYEAPSASGFSYTASGSPVEIIGQGKGQTTLTSKPGGNNGVLRLFGGAGSSVHDLTIRLPENAASGLSGLLTANMAQRIEVVEHPTQMNHRSGRGPAERRHARGLERDARQRADNERRLLLHRRGHRAPLAADARTGVYEQLWRHDRALAPDRHERRRPAYRGVTAIAGSADPLHGAGGTGISATVQSGSNTTVNADGVTILGPGLPDTSGASASIFLVPAQSAGISLTNSIIRGVSTALDAARPQLLPVRRWWPPPTRTTTRTATRPTGANASISDANVSNVGDAGFVDAAGGDYRLLPGSPLIDAGDPATAQGLDLDGNPLVADGNADGGARRDLGAFELQPAATGGGSQPGGGGQQGGGGWQGDPPVLDTQAPLVGGFRAAPSLFAVARAGTPVAARIARGTRFRYTLTEQARMTLKIQRALPGRRAGGKCVRPGPRLVRAKRCTRYSTVGTLTRNARAGTNRTRFTGRLGKRALRPGRYRALITATDAAGNRSARRSARFRIAGN